MLVGFSKYGQNKEDVFCTNACSGHRRLWLHVIFLKLLVKHVDIYWHCLSLLMVLPAILNVGYLCAHVKGNLVNHDWFLPVDAREWDEQTKSSKTVGEMKNKLGSTRPHVLPCLLVQLCVNVWSLDFLFTSEDLHFPRIWQLL